MALNTVDERDIAAVVLEGRLKSPGLPRELAARRRRRLNWEQDRLVILAADHTARRETAAGGDPWAMADRGELLRRIAAVLMQPGVDGLLATPDVMEELFFLNDWVRRQGGPDFLDHKVLIGSMNRAGLARTAFELDDFVTAYTAEAIENMRLDGGKLLLRLDPDNRDSSRTLRYCVEALNDLAARGLPAFLEPLSVPLETEAMVRLTGVATGLGFTSERRWLKLPMVEDFHRVARATTCPIVLLGGGRPGRTGELVDRVKRCLEAGHNVRGLMIGRGVLFPEDGEEPASVAARLAAAVHGGAAEEVIVWEGLQSTPSGV